MKAFRYFATLASLAVLVAVMAFGPVLPALAQDGGTDLDCNGLNETDCQILRDSAVAMADVYALSIPSYEAKLGIEVDSETMELSIAGAAAFALPSEAMALLSDLSTGESMTDVTPMLDLLDQIDAEYLVELLGDALVYVSVTDAFASIPDDMEGSLTGQLIFKDQGLYVQLPSPEAGDTWFGEELLIDAQALAELDVALAEMKVALLDEETIEGLSQIEPLTDLQMALAEAVAPFVVTTRGADQVIDGSSVAVFTTEFDLKGMLQSEAFAQSIVDILTDPALAELMDEDPALEDLNATQVQFVLMTVALVLGDNNTIETRQYVGLDDGYLYGMEGDLNLEIDATLLDAEAGTVALYGDFAVRLADFNAVDVAAIEVPAEYLPLDMAENYYVGTSDNITDALEAGDVVSVNVEEDSQTKVYAIGLEAGNELVLTMVGNSSPSVVLYGPDGFQVESWDYASDEMRYTADAAGGYLVVIDAYWGSYEMGVAVN